MDHRTIRIFVLMLVIGSIQFTVVNLKQSDIINKSCRSIPMSLYEVRVTCTHITLTPELLTQLFKNQEHIGRIYLKLENSSIDELSDAQFSNIRDFRLIVVNSTIKTLEIGSKFKFYNIRYNIIKNVTMMPLYPNSDERINLSYNFITHISPIVFKNKKTIYGMNFTSCNFTQIPTEIISNIESVEIWALSYNNFKNIPRETLTSPTQNMSMIIDAIEIKKNYTDEPVKLETMDKSDIYPSRIEGTKFNILELHLDHCNIREIETGAFFNLQIRSLYLSDNLLYSLQGSFVLCEIELLDISNNKFVNIHPKMMSQFGKFLITLLVKNNQIQVLHTGTFQHNSKLTRLDLTGNVITTIEPNTFHNLKCIKNQYPSNSMYLIINRKTIEPDYFAGLTNLYVLNLNNSGIEEILPKSFQGLHALTNIILSNNFISSLPEQTFFGLKKLRHIFLSHNKIIYVNPYLFDGIHELETIDLSHNNIRELPLQLFKSTLKIKTVKLNNNHILKLEDEAFSGLNLLQNLDLSYNRLENLSGDLINPLTQLNDLDVEGNYLEGLDVAELERHEYITDINLDKNSWICSKLKQIINYCIKAKIQFQNKIAVQYDTDNIHGIVCTNLDVDSDSEISVEEQIKTIHKTVKSRCSSLETYNWILGSGFLILIICVIIIKIRRQSKY